MGATHYDPRFDMRRIHGPIWEFQLGQRWKWGCGIATVHTLPIKGQKIIGIVYSSRSHTLSVYRPIVKEWTEEEAHLVLRLSGCIDVLSA